jgi:uncharacterized membrane protein YcjF (UPF0283 family)
MVAELWRKAVRIVVIAGAVLALFVFVEVARAYETLYALHPWIGNAFGAAVLLLLAWLLADLVGMLWREPPVLLPPPRLDAETASRSEIMRHVRYARALARRLPLNPLLNADHRDALRRAGEELEALAALRAGNDALLKGLRHAADEALAPAFRALDREAEKTVRRHVSQVMAGVTLSPWRSADLYIVLQRNLAMIGAVIRVYSSRPRWREQWSILQDVMGVVAIVQYMSFGTRLCERMFARIPFVGRFVDDIAQGVGAGLMTSVTGHATIQRCSAFRGWNREQARRTVAAGLQRFSTDIRKVLFDDVMQQLRERVRAEARWGREDPERVVLAFDKGVEEALDDTEREMDTFVRRSTLERSRDLAARSARKVVRAARATLNGALGTVSGAAGLAGRTGRRALAQAGRGVRTAAAAGRGLARRVRVRRRRQGKDPRPDTTPPP